MLNMVKNFLIFFFYSPQIPEISIYHIKRVTTNIKGAAGSVMVSQLDKQNFKSEFESHCVPYSYSFVPHLSKKLSKLQLVLLRFS